MIHQREHSSGTRAWDFCNGSVLPYLNIIRNIKNFSDYSVLPGNLWVLPGSSHSKKSHVNIYTSPGRDNIENMTNTFKKTFRLKMI
jgi:hypothetical protein